MNKRLDPTRGLYGLGVVVSDLVEDGVVYQIEKINFSNEMIGKPMMPFLQPGRYDCPFNILYEFEKWFEFKRRVIVDKEPTRKVISEMLRCDSRNAQDYLVAPCFDIKFDVDIMFGASVCSRSFIMNSFS